VNDFSITLGKLPPSAFGLLELPAPDTQLIEGLKALSDLTGLISDAMDLLGIEGVPEGGNLRPVLPGQRIVGPAITVKNVRRSDTVKEAVADGRSRLADIEAHNLARPGDVLVVQGVSGISSLGGISTAIAARQQEAGIVVDGHVRDVEAIREHGLPVWSCGVTPATGKWRLETISVNAEVVIRGVTVLPGDIVAADETGVCFIPQALAARVLAVAQTLEKDETMRLSHLSKGVPIRDLPKANHTPNNEASSRKG